MSTFVLIEKYTVGAGGASSVTLGSGGTIPQTYTDLIIKSSARCSVDGDAFKLQFNGVTSNSNYSSRMLVGNGSSASSNTPGQTNYILSGYTSTITSNTFGNQEIYVPNYTSSSAKSVSVDNVQEANQTLAYSNLVAGLYSTSTSGITSITIGFASGTIQQYSTFYLYGILKA